MIRMNCQNVFACFEKFFVRLFLVGENRYVRPLFAFGEFGHYDEVGKALFLHESRQAF